MSDSPSNKHLSRLAVVRIPNCPICCSGDVSVAFAATSETRARFRKLSEKKYQGEMNGWEEYLSLNISHCSSCDHHWHAEQPDKESLMSMYAAPMKGRGDRVIPKNDVLDQAITRQVLSLLKMVTSKEEAQATLLEFGGGLGRWVNAFQKAGFATKVYEPASERSDRGGRSNDNVVNDLGQLEGLQFDAINIEQVLEHVTDPVEELRRLKGFCRESTVLRITVPNFRKFAARQDPWSDYPYAGRMHILSPFEHLQGFSAESLRIALSQAGFKEISLTRLVKSHSMRAIARRIAGACFPQLKETAVYAVPVVD